MWPAQGVFVFAVMSAIPPFIALARRNFLAFAGSSLISIVALLLAGYTYFVPISIILLIVSFVVAVQKFGPGERRMAVFVRAAILMILAAAVAQAVRISIIYNWSPPKIFKQALSSPLTVDDRERAMTEALNSQFPKGSDEAALKSMLLKQGFEDVSRPQPSCRSSRSTKSTRVYESCPKETREMRYDYRHLISFPCGTIHLSVNWSVDPDGKITRIEATDNTICL